MDSFFAQAPLWLVTYLLHSTVLYGLAWLVDRRGLLRAPATRETLWRAALFGALLTASVQSAGFVEPVAFGELLAPTRLPAPTELLDAGASTAPILARAADGAGAPASLAVHGSQLAEHWPALLTLVWLAGAALAILRIVVRAWLARRELATRTRATSELEAELHALCDAFSVPRPRLSVTRALSGPISLPNGEIVLPPWVGEELDARRRKALLAHELAHLVRRDPLWRVLELVLGALLWIQPLHRLARRRLVAVAELEADAWAARAVRDPRALAECLAECAERLQQSWTASFGATLTGRSPLVERVERLMDGSALQSVRGSSWARRFARFGITVALCGAGLVLPSLGLESCTGGRSESTTVTVDDVGNSSVSIRRPDYRLNMESDGAFVPSADESDVATLAPGCVFHLSETLAGVKHDYTVESSAGGELTRAYLRDGRTIPADETAQRWLRDALPRMYRDSGLETKARIQRLLRIGGPARVLGEIERSRNAYYRGTYLGELLRVAVLDEPARARARAAALEIGSDFDRRFPDAHRLLEAPSPAAEERR